MADEILTVEQRVENALGERLKIPFGQPGFVNAREYTEATQAAIRSRDCDLDRERALPHANGHLADLIGSENDRNKKIAVATAERVADDERRQDRRPAPETIAGTYERIRQSSQPGGL